MPPTIPFWRRALAFAIDWIAAWLVVALLLQPFTAQGSLRLPTPLVNLGTEQCAPLDTPPAWLEQMLQGRAISHLRLCEQQLFGLTNGRSLAAILEVGTDPQGTTIRQFLRVPVGSDLTPSGFYDLSGLMVLLVLGLGSLALHVLGWPTPGRATMGLRLRASLPRAALREILRLGPLVLVLALPLAMPFRTLTALPVAAVLVIVAGAVVCWFAWLGLRFFTHGAPPRHDRISGAVVTRSRYPAP